MSTVKPSNPELQSFVDAIREATADLDFSLRCYSLTLREVGMSEKQIVAKIREVFFQIADELLN